MKNPGHTMRDPFANYDNWLVAPYERAAAQADEEEAAWEALGTTPDDLEAPHKAGGACPKCGEAKVLEDDGDGLYCASCAEGVERDEKPTFDIGEYMKTRREDAAEEAAERKAEAMAERDW